MGAQSLSKIFATLVVSFFSLTLFAGTEAPENPIQHHDHKDDHHGDPHAHAATPSSNLHAKDAHANHGGAVDTKEEVDAYIQHHLADSHDVVLWSDGEKGTHVGFPLPVILWDGGLKVGMSSQFHHGESVATIGGNHYKLFHGKVYKTDAKGTLSYDEHHHPTNEKPFDLSITKNVFAMLVTGLLLLLGFGSLAKGYKNGPIPKGIGRFLEPLVLYVRDEIAKPNIGERKYRKYMGFLLTIFFFIWLLNLLGLTPFGFNVTGNITFTACLALITFLIVQFSGNKDYWKHIFWMPGVPVPMKIILAPIELIGLVTKPFSLMVRLFANITAGHSVVMGIIAVIYLMKDSLGLVGGISVSMILGIFINLIELLVAFLQAYIFTMLASLFIGMAVEEHDHH